MNIYAEKYKIFACTTPLLEKLEHALFFFLLIYFYSLTLQKNMKLNVRNYRLGKVYVITNEINTRNMP